MTFKDASGVLDLVFDLGGEVDQRTLDMGRAQSGRHRQRLPATTTDWVGLVMLGGCCAGMSAVRSQTPDR